MLCGHLTSVENQKANVCSKQHHLKQYLNCVRSHKSFILKGKEILLALT